MNSPYVGFDSHQFDAMVRGLTGSEMKKVFIGALRASGNILKKETDKQFKSKIAIGDTRVKRKNKNGKEITKWRRLATVKIDKRTPEAKVHIMSDFRAKFFELGTNIRRTKGHKITGYYRLRPGGRRYRSRSGKGGNRGRIIAGHFFLKAQQKTERMIFDNTEVVITKYVMKVIKRRK
jgi:hypothetical protein